MLYQELFANVAVNMYILIKYTDLFELPLYSLIWEVN